MAENPFLNVFNEVRSKIQNALSHAEHKTDATGRGVRKDIKNALLRCPPGKIIEAQHISTVLCRLTNWFYNNAHSLQNNLQKDTSCFINID
jgi:hypothetical protein